MPELTLTSLRVVVEVARCGSFTAAAEALGYTQSAISRQVGAAEHAAGAALFARHARGVRPTAAGEVLLRHARRVVAHLEAADLEIAGLRDRLAGRLVVGSYPTAAAVLVPRAIARLRTAHPALVVDLRESGSPAQVRRLRARRIEVAVIAVGDGLPDYDVDGLHAEPLGPGPGLGIAVSDEHPFAAREQVDVAELAGQAWIVGSGGADEPQFGAWPTLAAPEIAHRSASWQTRLGMVAAGLGISLLPGMAADAAPRGVTWVRVHDPEFVRRRETMLLTAADRSPAADAFARAVHDELAAR
ncbi:LysR family transcriptional regulator [Saccharopolyspora gloriosae]|uniref:DNA-binding transcriptional LysR family regulator n=1 Tax=Saccharopolyspora gloriosae TaxID=455344 RepID=A0A840NF59_9PSEU|nr:LysR family transcriptional regulator [Saccharopolyspora gloriosae]MBB5068903.1 DNA-binding transcriptional LysR family regulator [Saccharopolyspora gloriosae]